MIGEVPEWLNGTVSKTVVGLVPTVGSNPTLSAEQIALFPLGDLAFKVHYPHCIYSSAIVKVLWDTGKAILTSAPSCPNSSIMSHLFACASGLAVLG